MLVLTESLTAGQITVIIRVVIQILSLGGVFLISHIILSTAPRVAPVGTHDVLNRIVGKSTSSKFSLKWILKSLTGRSGNPAVSTPLLVAVILSILYTLFVVLSDLGFLGIYACTTAGPSFTDYPASVNTTEAAQALVAASLVNGSDPSAIKAYRCDSVSVVNFGNNVTERNCTSWHNSTFAEPTIFTQLNTTDSAVLMPRQLRHLNQSREQYIDLNSYYVGVGSRRVVSTTISNGILVDPYETGLKVILGVPQLGPQEKVTLNKTFALEADVGCMALGIYSQHDPDAADAGIDIYATEGNWRNYTGPDYLEGILSTTVDALRRYYLPFFNASSLDSSGFMYGINETQAALSAIAFITSFFPPNSYGTEDGSTAADYILGNCSNALQSQLNLTILDSDTLNGTMCSLMSISGSTTQNGTLLEGLSRMACASAAQINMVSATVETDEFGVVTLTNLTRLPSDLYYLQADYWDAQTVGNDTTFYNFDPFERYTLADNPAGPTEHYIAATWEGLADMRSSGPGSGGSVLSGTATVMLQPDPLSVAYTAISILDVGYDQINFTTDAVTSWAGQVGATYILTSTAYNGYAALSQAPVRVESTGGKSATCYHPPYSLAFLPLALAALVVGVWSLGTLIARRALGASNKLQELYGGIHPLVGAEKPRMTAEGTLLAWQNEGGHPRLEVCPTEMKDTSETAMAYFKTSNAHA